MLFTREAGGNTDLYVLDASLPRRLTSDPGHDYGGVWSPDGSRIAFVSDRDGDDEIFVMNADGSGQTQLTRAPGQDQAPAWSPDGTRLAFASTRAGGEAEIYVMRADGTRPTRLTTTERFVVDHTPTWAPDGSYLAFTSNRAGSDNNEIYRMTPDGRDVRRLTTTAAGVDDGSPDVSADGSRIVFSSTRDGNQQDLFVMAADGSGVRRLTGDPALDDVFPRWTPGGDRVLFQTFATASGATENLWSVGADGSGRTAVLATEYRDSFPDARP